MQQPLLPPRIPPFPFPSSTPTTSGFHRPRRTESEGAQQSPQGPWKRLNWLCRQSQREEEHMRTQPVCEVDIC